MNWYNDIAVGVTRHISSFWASHTLQLLANLMNPRNTLKAFILEFKIFPHICLFISVSSILHPLQHLKALSNLLPPVSPPPSVLYQPPMRFQPTWPLIWNT